jgi:RND family efflux transporter MFP subunit
MHTAALSFGGKLMRVIAEFCSVIAGVAVLGFGGALLTASDAAAQRAGRHSDLAPVVTIQDVKIERINERVAAVGSARARQHVTMTTRVAGVIAEVMFEGGQLVEANQALVRLNDDPERIAVETAEAQRAQAADTVDRYKQLNEGTVTRVAIAQADTALKVADAALRRARDDLDRMTIKAPFKGIMGLSTLEVGDYLAVGTPIAPIDDRTSLLVEFTVPESVASQMKVGLPVRATLVTRPGEPYSGKIQAVDTRIDPVTRTLVVRAEIPNPDLKLIPGSTFSVSIRLPGKEAPVVPALAIQWDRQGAFVWRVTDKNTVERVNVVIVSREANNVHLDAALKSGDRIVVEGGASLRPDQTVRQQGS